MNLKIIKTDDGSDTLYNKKLDETYHSLHGSVTESKHVYINAGLSSVIDENSKGPISILEVGLGTGLNLLLTLKFAKKNDLKIQYHAIEPFEIEASHKLYIPDLQTTSCTEQCTSHLERSL